MGPTAKKIKEYQELYIIIWNKITKLLEEEKVKIHERGV